MLTSQQTVNCLWYSSVCLNSSIIKCVFTLCCPINIHIIVERHSRSNRWHIKELLEEDAEDFHDCMYTCETVCILAVDPTNMNDNTSCSVVDETISVLDTTETSCDKILKSHLRRRSAITESLPDTTHGWAALTSVLAALTLG